MVKHALVGDLSHPAAAAAAAAAAIDDGKLQEECDEGGEYDNDVAYAIAADAGDAGCRVPGMPDAGTRMPGTIMRAIYARYEDEDWLNNVAT
jgi:hypothetical protein